LGIERPFSRMTRRDGRPALGCARRVEGRSSLERWDATGTRPFAQNAKERGTPNLGYWAVYKGWATRRGSVGLESFHRAGTHRSPVDVPAPADGELRQAFADWRMSPASKHGRTHPPFDGRNRMSPAVAAIERKVLLLGLINLHVVVDGGSFIA